MPILKPGYVRWTGTLYTTDPSIEIVGPAGPQGLPGPSGSSGTNGENAFTTLSSSFSQPLPNSSVTTTVANPDWLIPGMSIFITTGGYYTVNTVTGHAINITNTGAAGNASSSTTIPAGSQVSPAGIQGPTGSSTGSTGTFNCLSSLAVLNIVYVTGTGDTVAAAQANSLSTLPAVGIVISKPTTLTAVVQYSGEISGFSSLTTGATYYLSDNTAGTITSLVPSTIGHAVQVLGVARDATKLVLAIDRPVIL